MNILTKRDVDLLDWPPRVPADKALGICVSLVPNSTLCAWLLKEAEMSQQYLLYGSLMKATSVGNQVAGI